MRIALASDHAGYEYKSNLYLWLIENSYECDDLGCYSIESVDYPDYAFAVAESVAKEKADIGIIICGTGIGVSIAANKVNGIRAANCCSVEMAKLAREHNDANVLTFGARLISFELAKEIVEAFVHTQFLHGRHQIRVNKLNK